MYVGSGGMSVVWDGYLNVLRDELDRRSEMGTSSWDINYDFSNNEFTILLPSGGKIYMPEAVFKQMRQAYETKSPSTPTVTITSITHHKSGYYTYEVVREGRTEKITMDKGGASTHEGTVARELGVDIGDVVLADDWKAHVEMGENQFPEPPFPGITITEIYEYTGDKTLKFHLNGWITDTLVYDWVNHPELECKTFVYRVATLLEKNESDIKVGDGCGFRRDGELLSVWSEKNYAWRPPSQSDDIGDLKDVELVTLDQWMENAEQARIKNEPSSASSKEQAVKGPKDPYRHIEPGQTPDGRINGRYL